MNFLKWLAGRAFLAGATWVLVAGALPAQNPGIPYSMPGGVGIGSGVGFGLITNNFGATGLGTGPYGSVGHLSMGISSGGSGFASYGTYGGGGSGGLERPGPLTGRERAELDKILGPPRPAPSVAAVRVIVPTRDAQLWVDDTLMTKQGTSRSFISPLLVPERQFLYSLKVRYKDREGRVVEQARSIRVHAGSQEIVDFTRPEKAAPTVSQ